MAKLVKILRNSLDSDSQSRGKAIMLAVSYEAAGSINQMNSNNDYAGSMMPFFSNNEAMAAVSDINIMSYNTGISNFYSGIDLIDNILNQFQIAGVLPQKLILGIQPWESGGFALTSQEVVNQLTHHVKEQNYGGLFLWGIGTGRSCGQASAEDYIKAMLN